MTRPRHQGCFNTRLHTKYYRLKIKVIVVLDPQDKNNDNYFLLHSHTNYIWDDYTYFH